ncbi:MAG: hypothetical protein JW384_01666 [Nitrosomonadaceae bacterium]|nr:hypothetical protein [Nitrosomonadaceae bacterium]
MKKIARGTFTPLAILASIVLISPVQSDASPTGLSNFTHCLKESRKSLGKTSAQEISRICREQFPKKRPKDQNLSPDVLNKIDADGGPAYGTFSGSLFNGNTDYTITQVTLHLTPIHPEIPLITNEYTIDMNAAPLTKAALSVALTSDRTREFSWRLINARGYKAR